MARLRSGERGSGLLASKAAFHCNSQNDKIKGHPPLTIKLRYKIPTPCPRCKAACSGVSEATKHCAGVRQRGRNRQQTPCAKCGVLCQKSRGPGGAEEHCWKAPKDGICKRCANPFQHIGRGSKLYCSEECKLLDYSEKYSHVCIVCKRDFKSAREESKCCGTACGIAHTIALTRAKHDIENNQCERCGITFAAGKCDGKRRRFCSRICAYAFAKAHPELKRLPDLKRPGQAFSVKRRRYIKIAARPRERVTIGDIIARDGAKCHICGIETDASVRALEPTIDHVIPIALGGAHVLANVKLAHRVCNSLKGDRKLTAKLQRACRDRIKIVKRATPAKSPNLTGLSTMEGDSDGQPEAKALASRD